MDNFTIRIETEKDYRAVEELTREAFWNVYKPGADEHYYVHMMRSHPDFIPELAFVLELGGQLIGNVMYTRSWLLDEQDNRKTILTFGPVSIHPDHQRKGYGKQLLEHSFAAARELGYDAIVIFGNPDNYVSRGFVSCAKYGISMEEFNKFLELGFSGMKLSDIYEGQRRYDVVLRGQYQRKQRAAHP